MAEKKQDKFNGVASKEISRQILEDRVSYVMTGMPLASLYKSLSKAVPEKDLGEILLDMRQVGLRPEEIEQIPSHHLANLRDFKTTIGVIGEVVKQAEHVYSSAEPASLPIRKSYVGRKIREQLEKPKR